MDLSFDNKFASETGSHIFRFLGGVCYGSRLSGDAKFRKKFAGLKFMDIHVVKWRSLHAPGSEEKTSFKRKQKKYQAARSSRFMHRSGSSETV
jgi:hypothetical protein